MPSPLEPVDQPLPLVDVAWGPLRVAAMNAVALGRPGAAPAAACDELLGWARAEAGPAASARGMRPDGVDARWFGALQWTGMPFAVDGALRWATDVVAAEVERPTVGEGGLQVPAPDRLRAASGLDLKPLRAFVGQRCGCRLQAAPGVHCWLWAERCVLVSCAAVPVGGFLYGPGPGQRAAIALEPGGWQSIRW